jgi:diacylglycerol O-acyltransferase
MALVREPMRSVDAAWMQMDRPENTADVVALLRFSRPLRFPTVRRLIRDRLLASERLRQRVEPRSLGRAPTWAEDPAFSLDRHLTRIRLPRAPDALPSFVAEVANDRLDPAHPPWRMFQVEGAGAGSALVVKVHHCIGDGAALVDLLLSLADEGAEAGRRFRTSTEHAIRSYRDLALRRGMGAALGALRAPRKALELAAEAGAFGRSLLRMATMSADPPSPLSRPLTGRRRVAWTRPFPLAGVRDAARASGGATVNELVTAALAGALRGELQAAGETVDRLEIRALVPVNLRPSAPTAADLGNRFGLVFMPLPLGAGTPEARLAAVRQSSAELKASPDALVAYAVLGLLGLGPGALERLGTDFFSRKASLVVTNVPGPRQPLHLAGTRLDELLFWVPHPTTLGVGVSILSYAGELRVGVRADVATLSDPASLVERFEREMGRLLAAAPRPPAPSPEAPILSPAILAGQPASAPELR